MEEKKKMNEFNAGENIDGLKKEAFKKIDDNLRKELEKLGGVQKEMEIQRLQGYLSELENKKKETQENTKIADRFKARIIEQIEGQILTTNTSLEILRRK